MRKSMLLEKVLLASTLLIFQTDAAAVQAPAVDASQLPEPKVLLAQGTYLGTSEERQFSWGKKTVHKYQSIPFGKAARFGPPELVAPDSGAIVNATMPMSACIQQHSEPATAGMPAEIFPETEDCLNLNVFASASPGKKPVMVFLYGGGFMFGSGGNPIYDGSNLAAHDVVVVVPNYRTNVFGFPGIVEGIEPENRNLGLLDQRLALTWVQENIEKFGGDPTAVTVFGHSAGAISIDHHLASYKKKNVPFRGAILQSGFADTGAIRMVSAGGNRGSFMQLAQGLGCTANELECVKNSTVESIKAAMTSEKLFFFPTIDEVTVLKNPVKAKELEDAVRVPVMIGNTADEGSLFTSGLSTSFNMTMKPLLDMFMPNEPQKKAMLLSTYSVGPDQTYQTSFEALSGLVTDSVFKCPIADEADRFANELSPTWRYLYSATFPNTDFIPMAGAYHGSELALVFGNAYEREIAAAETEEQVRLSEQMMLSWTNFAKNPESGPGWFPIVGDGRNEKMAVFDSLGRHQVMVDAIDENCEVLDGMEFSWDASM